MRGLSGILVLVFAALALLCGAVLMPVSELMPATVQSGSWMPGLSPVRSYDAMQEVRKVGNAISGLVFSHAITQADANPKSAGADAVQKVIVDTPFNHNMPGEIRAYVAYAVFLSLAMIFAAIAINAVGRWDSEEKTIIPLKK
jgi:hypothetical protein